MRLNVTPLMEAIEKYIAKANDDLERTLEEEGFTAASAAVSAINKIEDDVASALETRAKILLDRIKEAENVEEFIAEVWPDMQDEETLKAVIKEMFREQFNDLLKTFTYSWMSDAGETMTEIYEDAPTITAPMYDFISSWSSKLAEMMNLATNNQIEKILRQASDENLGINQVAEMIADGGIRDAGYRARRVAVTEVLRMESYSQLEAMIQNPLAYKKRWVHKLSNDPRLNHMVIHGQEVFKREPFTLVGKDGVTYKPQLPRDICLPAGESINCHCIMETIADDSATGMSKEKQAELREQAINDVNAEWAMDHKSDKVNIILDMDDSDQIRYFGGKKDGEAKLALVKGGIVDTDEKLRNLYKTDENGKISLKSLQELADDGIFTVSDSRLKHSAVGDYTAAVKQYPTGRMKSGGHGQAAMNMCDTKGIEYTVTKTFSNGVRIGNVPTSEMSIKRTGNGQLWFPESWDEEKIRIAGTVVANNGDEWVAGYRKTGVYEGVAVQVQLTNGNIGTVCPDYDQSKFVERFPELSLFYRLFSPLNSEMICIFPYFCPYAESAREIREIFS